MNMQQPTWPQSALNIRSALCLNEIVNAPDEFVSKVYISHQIIKDIDKPEANSL